jgi:hypothetical protein
MSCVFLPGSRRIHAPLYRQRYRFIPPQPPFLDAAGSTSRGRVAGGSTPVVLESPGWPGLDGHTSRFEGSYNLLGPKVLESPLLGYKRVQGGFEGAWMVRRSR